MDQIIAAATSFGVAVLVFIVQGLMKDNKRLREARKNQNTTKETNLADGVLCLLRIQLIEYHTKYTGLGRIPTYAYESFDLMHKAYTALGGNGTVGRMKEDIDELEVSNRKGEKDNEK